MAIEFDSEKRALNLKMRGLDFVDAAMVFAGPTLTYQDVRRDYGEVRWITVGLLRTRMVVLVWTERGVNFRIVSMRKANDREQQIYGSRLV